MTTGFDLDEIERLLAATKYVFSHVEDYAEAVEAYHAGLRKASPAMLTEIRELRAENARLKEALVRLRDCDWVISLPDRMDAVRDIARAALGEPQ